MSGARHRMPDGNGGGELSGSESRIDLEESNVVELGSSDDGRACNQATTAEVKYMSKPCEVMNCILQDR